MNALPKIISVDDHVVEGPNVWWDRLSSKDRERGPRVIKDTCEMIKTPGNAVPTYIRGGDGPVVDWWVYEDLVKPIPMTFAAAGVPQEQWTKEAITYEFMRTGCYDPAARLDDMDLNHTERSMCFPTISRFCGQMFLEASDRDLALKCVQAYNDWMIDEWCGDSNGRLIPICMIPLWDPVEAAREIRRNAARGCTAVTFAELPALLGLPSIHSRDRWWDPFFAACDETGTVISMHIGSGTKMPVTSEDAPSGVRLSLTVLNAQMSFNDWLLSAIFERFKNLRIAFSEGQVGWMPFMLERLDRIFEHSYALLEVDRSLQLPSSYIANHVFGCVFDDFIGIDLREKIGVRQIMFETDYPHQDGTWPHSIEMLKELSVRLPDEELELVVRDNAIRAYSLPAALPE